MFGGGARGWVVVVVLDGNDVVATVVVVADVGFVIVVDLESLVLGFVRGALVVVVVADVVFEKIVFGSLAVAVVIVVFVGVVVVVFVDENIDNVVVVDAVDLNLYFSSPALVAAFDNTAVENA